MSLGFIKLPRSLRRSRIWNSLSLIHRHVFETILDHAAYNESLYDMGGLTIIVNPGQFCTTHIQLAKFCDPDGNLEITKDMVRRSLEKLCQVGFLKIEKNATTPQKTTQDLTQKMTRKKTLITIIQSDICNHSFNNVDAGDDANNDAKMTQKRRKNDAESKKNRKKEGKEDYIAHAQTIAISLPSLKQYGEVMLLTDDDYKKLLEEMGQFHLDEYIDRFNNYCLSKGVKYKDHAATIRGWYRKAKSEGKLSHQKVVAQNFTPNTKTKFVANILTEEDLNEMP